MRKIQRLLKGRYRAVLLTLLCLLIVGVLLFTGILWPNVVFVASDSVQGLDVSSYQGQIDWQSVAQTRRYTFVFIKATEGKNAKDAAFQANWRGAQAQSLLHGAYHYYTDNRTGTEQADNFISVVPKEVGMLPPVLDLEVSGTNHTAMLREITVFLDRLEQYYGVKPIIYTDQDRYAQYIQGNFTGYTIWLRDVFTPVGWSNVKNWTFWQYDDRGHVLGIANFVDLNVFAGGKNQFYNFVDSSITH